MTAHCALVCARCYCGVRRSMAERGHSWLQASKGSQRPFDDGHAWGGGFRVSVSVSVKLIKHSSTAATRVQRIMGLNKLRAPLLCVRSFFGLSPALIAINIYRIGECIYLLCTVIGEEKLSGTNLPVLYCSHHQTSFILLFATPTCHSIFSKEA